MPNPPPVGAPAASHSTRAVGRRHAEVGVALPGGRAIAPGPGVGGGMGWDAFGHAGLLLVSKRAGLGCPSGRTHMGHHPQNPSLLTHGVFRGCIPTHNHIGIHPMVSTIVPFFCVVPASGHSVSPITKRSVGNGEFLGTECNSAF